jgi:hypothetical protein
MPKENNGFIAMERDADFSVEVLIRDQRESLLDGGVLAATCSMKILITSKD